MHRFLHAIAGPDKGQRYQISDAFTTLLGRSRRANSQLTDNTVSRVHCEIEIRNRRILLADLDSAGGTFVNGRRVGECELKDGDLLQIGNTQLRVEKPFSATDSQPSTIPPRPVITSSERLKELTGNQLSHFEIGPVLAKGQCGLVFRATNLKNDRPVAVKVLWPEFSQDEQEMQRFIRAMKTMMPLQHPNLVTLHGAGKTGVFCWVAMELVEGECLTQLIARLGAANMLDWRRALRITYSLAKALDYAHGKSIIHRNITPQNVLIGQAPDEIKLGDLMLAKAQEGSLAQQITKPGEILGDLRYMSPERTGDSNDVDARSDLYGLGALLYAMLTGRPPFEGNNLVETVTKIRQAQPVQPKKYQLAIPDAVDGVALKLLAKRPEERMASAAALLKDLERVAKFYSANL